MFKRNLYRLHEFYRLFYDLLKAFFGSKADATDESYNKWYFILSTAIEDILQRTPELEKWHDESWRPFSTLAQHDRQTARHLWNEGKEAECRRFLSRVHERYVLCEEPRYTLSAKERNVTRECYAFIHGDPTTKLVLSLYKRYKDRGEPRTSQDVSARDESTGSDDEKRGASNPHHDRFPTPPGSRWEDTEIRFKDGHTVSIRVGETRGIYNFTDMGMSNRKTGSPTLQWELLRDMAEYMGYVTWDLPFADRKNQKRKDRLAEHLQQFFDIKGHPFRLLEDKKGWQTRFKLYPDHD